MEKIINSEWSLVLIGAIFGAIISPLLGKYLDKPIDAMYNASIKAMNIKFSMKAILAFVFKYIVTVFIIMYLTFSELPLNKPFVFTLCLCFSSIVFCLVSDLFDKLVLRTLTRAVTGIDGGNSINPAERTK